ncbi:MAG: hypothetical protein ACR2QE_03180, partial [Acidimicrobiales bacterium]
DPGPLSARDRSLIIPVDDGYVVFGTYRDGDESDPLIEDGAHYDRASSTWTMLPSYPFERGDDVTVDHGTASGDAVLVFLGENGAGLRPGEDRWRELPPAPAPVGEVHQLDDGRLLSWSARATFEPEIDGGRWVRWAPEPEGFVFAPEAGRESEVWTGDELLLFNHKGTATGNARIDGIAYDPDSDRWRELPSLSTEGTDSSGLELARDGDRVVITATTVDLVGDPDPETARFTHHSWEYRLADDQWLELPDLELSDFGATRGQHRLYASGGHVVLVSDALYLLTENGWVEAEDSLDVFDAGLRRGVAVDGRIAAYGSRAEGNNSFIEIDLDLLAAQTTGPTAPALTGVVTDFDPGPLSTRHEAAVVDIGDELVVWGGDIEGSNFGRSDLGFAQFNDGAVYNWVTGEWRTMTESPLPASEVTPIGVWTGTEVVIARGTEVAAWDPIADEWRTLADLPDEPDDLFWTGTYVLASGVWMTLDPADDRWRAIAEPPEVFVDAETNFSLRSQWIDSRLFVVSGRGAQTNVGRLTTAAYEPESDSWTDYGEILIPQGHLIYTAEFEGDLVAATSGRELWRFDLASNTWNEMADLPLPDLEGGHPITGIGDTLLAGHSPAAIYTTEAGWISAGPPTDLGLDALVPWRGRLMTWGMVPGGENRFVVVDPGRLTEIPTINIGYLQLQRLDGEEVVSATLQAGPNRRAVIVELATPSGICTIVDRPPDASAPALEVQPDQSVWVTVGFGSRGAVTCDDTDTAVAIGERLITDNRPDD